MSNANLPDAASYTASPTRTDGVVAGRIVRDMNDGVLAVDLSGTIIEFNPAAARILGMDADALRNSSFAEAFLMLPNDAFNQTILDAVYDSAASHNRIVPFTSGERNLTLSVTTSFLVDAGATSERIGVIAVFNDITELRTAQAAEERLALELRDKHRELQDAYRATEERNNQLQSALKKVQVIRITATVFSIVLFVGLGLYVWSAPSTLSQEAPMSAMPAMPSGTAGGAGGAAGGADFFTVTPGNHVEKLSLSGKVRPLRMINVTAPFAGKIGALEVDYGHRVEPGKLLLRMDDTDAGIRHREAQAAAIKAGTAYRGVEHWQSGAEMARARRALMRAKMALDASEKQVEETTRLFDKGIIPASELDAARERLQNQKLDLASAEEELAAVEAKGDAPNLAVARMEMTNAQIKATGIEKDLARAHVRASVAGLVMMPLQDDERGGSGGGERNKPLAIGRSVQQDEVLLAIGDLTGIAIALRVDEIDVTRLQVGMKASIGFDAFPETQLQGQLAALSQHAAQGNNSAEFTATVSVEAIPPELRARLLMGMSANVDIFIRDETAMLMVPLSAVLTQGNARYVFRSAADTPSSGSPGSPSSPGHVNPPVAVKVTTGPTTRDRVEIVSGLNAGDRILSQAPTTLPQAQQNP